MARKSAARPCAESDRPEICRHDGKERPRTRLPPAQTAPPGRGSRAPHPSEVLRFCNNRASSCRATWPMRASLAVALGEYNGRASQWRHFAALREDSATLRDNGALQREPQISQFARFAQNYAVPVSEFVRKFLA